MNDCLKTLRWFLLTSGRLYGKPLRTSALTAIDPVADRKAWRMFLLLGKLFNSKLLIGGDAAFMLMLLRVFDRDLRWWSVAANDRPEVLRKLLFDPNTLPGFNDSGAHLTNIAFFDGNLVTLQWAQQESIERVAQTVRRLTRAPAEFFGLDVGSLEIGAQADVTVIDPKRLQTYDTDTGRCWIYRDIFEHEQLVNRSDGVVSEVMIAGELVWQNNAFKAPFGECKLGRALTVNG